MSGVRLVLKDHQWEPMEPHLPGEKSDPGRSGEDNRLFVEAVPWVAPCWRALARSTRDLRQSEQRVRPLFALVEGRRAGSAFRCHGG